MRSRRLISIDLTLLLIEILDFRQADRTWGVLQGEEQGDSTDERDGGRNGETELPRRIAVMVQQKSADDTDKTRTDRVGRIPDRLLGRELRRLDPMRHETDARRHAHTLEITVQHPK